MSQLQKIRHLHGLKATTIPNLACECGLVMECKEVWRAGTKYVVLVCSNKHCHHFNVEYKAPLLELVELASVDQLVARGVIPE